MNSLYELAVIFSAIDQMTGPAKKIFGGIKNYENMITKGKGMYDYGKQLGVSSVLAQNAADKMTGALQSLVEPTLKIQDALAPLESVTTSTMGSMQKSMDASRKAAIQWSKIHSDAADDFLKTSTIIAGAGLNDIQAIEGTRAALTVAKATFGEAGESAELLGVLYNNLGDKTKNVRAEMTRLGDVVTVTQQMFQIKNLSQLNEGLKYGVPAALQYKISIEELNTVLGMLNTSGLAGGQAGTAFNATMRQMIKASQELGFEVAKNADGGVSFIKTIENIRKKYGEFGEMSDATKMKFQDAFGDEGLRAISLLIGKTGDLNKALKAVTNSTGAAAKAQKLIELKSPAEQYKIWQNNIDAVKDTLAVNLLPTINVLVPKVIQLVDRFGQFAEKHPKLMQFAVTIFAIGAGVLAIVAPIMSVVSGISMMGGIGLQGLGKLVKGLIWLKTGIMGVIPTVWSFTAALLANPITWIVLAVVALAAGAYLLIRNWDKVKTFFIGLWQSITEMWNKFLAWGKKWGINLIMEFVAGMLNPVGLIVKAATKIVGTVKKYLGFHSPAEAGPGADAHKWAPNLMQMYASGINAGTPGVGRAALAAAMSVSMALGQANPAMSGAGQLSFQSAPVGTRIVQMSSAAPAPAKQIVFKDCTFKIITDSPDNFFKQLKDLAEECEA